MNLSFGSSGEDKENLIIKGRRQRRTIFQKQTTQLFLWHLPLQTLHHPCSPPLGANYYFTSFLYHRAPACTQSSRWGCSSGGQRGTIPSFNRLSMDMAGPETQAQQPSGQAFSDDEQSQPSHLQPGGKALPWGQKSMLLEIWRLAKHTTVSWNTTVICGYAAVTFKAACVNWETFCDYHIYIISRILANH